MATTIINLFNSQITIGDFVLLIPTPAGLGDMGILSLIALLISVIFSVLFVVWIALIIYAGIMYISSNGDPEKMQGGFKIIQNIIIGIAFFFGFIVVVSIFGVFTGVGNVFEWSENLAQCGESGEFYFTAKERIITDAKLINNSGVLNIGCCYDSENNTYKWMDAGTGPDTCKNIRTINY